MKITGVLKEVMPVESGRSERGDWSRGGFVIETLGEYHKFMAFSLMGERLSMIDGLVPGVALDVTFSAESRKYNDRWYSELKCLRVDVRK